ncbi:class I SAM-dependent methyltransferase [Roseateles saccharophilus]|uniref:Methyltransferase family protein n=1 Tax=Roseateles saccharophilus TaxID=304 RepID=A0A4R3VF57_ROSSA|nr:class I SAM-dependent methyltransferase [Roseateles saccharophilus]MDG0832291.1 class I SAM-dependent methyltransferase [Roseateles saccharophilus]TCV02334.1 methyltransferase family protein [Roseateles saccharophilus]
MSRSHWEEVYGSKAADAVSWYAPHLDESLGYIRRTGIAADAAIIDVGGGEATLVDDLLGAGYSDVTVLDISARALEVCRARLAGRAAQAKWLAADVLVHDFAPRSVDVWHDRAVFHFLTEPAQRQRYVAQVLRALKPGGYAIVGTFGPQGPTQCSGLPVARYSSESLHDEFGNPFQLIDHSTSLHTTPWGATQQFVYCYCRREH